jgi:hypothetical protein
VSVAIEIAYRRSAGERKQLAIQTRCRLQTDRRGKEGILLQDMSATDVLTMLAQEETPPATGSGSRLGSAVVIVSGTAGVIAVLIAGVFAFIATCISLFSIWLQLKNYRKPILQRYVVRILLMYALPNSLTIGSLYTLFPHGGVSRILPSLPSLTPFGMFMRYV